MGFYIRDRQSLKKCRQHKDKLGVDQGRIDAEHLGIDLVKLAVASLLRSFPAKHGPDGIKFANRIFGIQFVLDIGSNNGCGGLGS